MADNITKTGSTGKAVTANNSRKYIITIAGMGLMTAIVVVLQLLASTIHLGPFSITLTLAPIIVGAAVFGWWAGAWLGLVFGVIVLLSGDAAAFLEVNTLGTIITVLVKGVGAGLFSGLVYRALEKKNKYVAVVSAGITAPVVNTGLFLVGCFLFFMPTITQWAGDQPVMEYIVVGFIGLNFPIELMINLALSTVIVTIIGYVRKTLAER